ncbi:MAG TPA: PKD domain-containing protein, partial [Symbiobacteriaceae bacterium]|nr:PKD domain-containing protein [Symbiobacteriaceae bacterium]
RIDPVTNAVDLTVSLGPGAGPYNYSDMTGSILIGAPDSGTWTVVHDSQVAGARWGTVGWTADVPAGASLTVTAASSEDGVTFGPTEAVTDGADLTVADGRYLKVMVSFQRSPGGESPILYDLTVRSNQAPTVSLSPAGPLPEGGAPVILTATAADPDGDALTYSWSLAGPGTLTAAGASATYSNDDGPAAAVITVMVSDGFESASDHQTVLTYNVAPQPDAGADMSEYWGIALAFSGSATDPSTADTLAGLGPQWNFGDMSGAMGFAASHAYANPGTYLATLTATDKDGGTGTDSAQVAIMKRPTALAYSGDTTASFGGATLAADLSDAVVPGPLAGRTVTFTVDGNTLTATTDGAGHAAVAVPFGLLPGVYTVDVAYGGDSHYEPSLATATLTVENTPGKITAGTMRFANNGRGGFNVMFKDGAVTGELQFQNNSTKLHAHTMTALSISADHTKGWFAGTGTDGRTFVAYVEDNGEPGTGDVFRLWIDGTPVNGSGQPLSGNIQIHK